MQQEKGDKLGQIILAVKKQTKCVGTTMDWNKRLTKLKLNCYSLIITLVGFKKKRYIMPRGNMFSSQSKNVVEHFYNHVLPW